MVKWAFDNLFTKLESRLNIGQVEIPSRRQESHVHTKSPQIGSKFSIMLKNFE